jgi:PAS domain S-box-containing protein
MAEVLCTGVPVHSFEMLVERPDGRRLTCLVNIEPLRDPHSEIAGAINCFCDVSEPRRASEQTREDSEQLRAIIETTPECIKIVARDGTLLHMNPAGLQMVQAQRPTDVVGGNTFDLIVPEHGDQWRRNHLRVCERLSWEFDIVGLDGARRHMETHAAPLHSDGDLVQLAITRDVTEKRRYELRYREMQMELARRGAGFRSRVYFRECRAAVRGLLHDEA